METKNNRQGFPIASVPEPTQEQFGTLANFFRAIPNLFVPKAKKLGSGVLPCPNFGPVKLGKRKREKGWLSTKNILIARAAGDEMTTPLKEGRLLKRGS